MDWTNWTKQCLASLQSVGISANNFSEASSLLCAWPVIQGNELQTNREERSTVVCSAEETWNGIRDREIIHMMVSFPTLLYTRQTQGKRKRPVNGRTLPGSSVVKINQKPGGVGGSLHSRATFTNSPWILGQICLFYRSWHAIRF